MRILVIEDDHTIANSIKKGLIQERYEVDVTYSGSEGYDLASTEEYDVIILDIMLPEMDGITICNTLRKEKIHTPILILTAKSQTQDKIKGLDTGADDYLSKPFSFEELLARIRALTRRPKVILPSLLIIEDLSVNTQTYEVTRAGKIINLSRKEFSLLSFLMRNKGMVLSKEKIIGNIWNFDADILPNTVEAYIKNLRKKIDHPFAKNKQLLHTVRGFGYRINDN
jgi:DNA-binding response OmpR family regulator